eukprot:2765063-Karenia_brevis.AAC.1
MEIESIRMLPADAKQRLEQGGQLGFVDATQEEGPPEEELSPEAEGTASSPSPDDQSGNALGGFLSIPEEGTLEQPRNAGSGTTE